LGEQEDRAILYHIGRIKQAQQMYAANAASKKYEPPVTRKPGASFPALVSRLAEHSRSYGYPYDQAQRGALRDASSMWFYYPHREDLSR
jgi:hypothetical protein